MKANTPKLLLFLILFSTQICLANDKEEEKHFHGVDTSKSMDVKDIIEISHETIEGDEKNNFKDDFLESLNFKKKVIESIRVNNQFKEYSGRDVLIDSLLLFGLSHSIEMMSGPIGMSYGQVNGWDPALIWGVGVVGAVISIPGLDPLCWLVFYTYAKSDKFRKGVKSIRVVATKTIDYVDLKLHISKKIKKHLRTISALEQITEKLKPSKSLFNHKKNEAHYIYKYPVNPFQAIELDMVTKEGQIYLDKLSIPSSVFDYGYDKRKLREWLKPFGWNIRHFVVTSIEHYNKEKEVPGRPYIEKVNSMKDWTNLEQSMKDREWLDIKLAPEVINKTQKHRFKSCKKAFN